MTCDLFLTEGTWSHHQQVRGSRVRTKGTERLSIKSSGSYEYKPLQDY